jgi:hypothetical protein
MHDLPEADWKVLREMRPDLLNRLCARILDELRGVIDDPAGTPHERYLRLFELLQDRNDEVASAFDDMRRSRAIERMLQMHRLGLFTPQQLDRFTPATRDFIVGWFERPG